MTVEAEKKEPAAKGEEGAAADAKKEKEGKDAAGSKTPYIIGGVAVAVLAGGLAYYFLTKKGDDQMEGGKNDDLYTKFVDQELNNWVSFSYLNLKISKKLNLDIYSLSKHKSLKYNLSQFVLVVKHIFKKF